MRTALFALVAVAFALTAVLPAGAQSGNRQALERAKNRIAEVAREIEAAEGEAATAEDALARAESQLAEVELAVNEAANALARQEAAVAEATDELGRLERDRRSLRQRLERRAVELYKAAGKHPLEYILTAADLDVALERSAYLRVLGAADRANLEALVTAGVAVTAQRALLEAQREEMEQLKLEQEALLEEVEALTRTRALAAAAAAERVRRLEAEKDDLEDDAAALEELIERTQVTPPRTTAPSPGGYQWPRCDTVTSEYGYRWGRLHAGLDIDGDTGSPIYAAKGGTVIFAGWQGGYGKLTLVDHGDGVVTAYAHQSSQHVSGGQSVSRGQQIGTVGTTGSSTGSHLHFETRVHGGAVNPRRFLPSGC